MKHVRADWGNAAGEGSVSGSGCFGHFRTMALSESKNMAVTKLCRFSLIMSGAIQEMPLFSTSIELSGSWLAFYGSSENTFSHWLLMNHSTIMRSDCQLAGQELLQIMLIYWLGFWLGQSILYLIVLSLHEMASALRPRPTKDMLVVVTWKAVMHYFGSYDGNWADCTCRT